MSTIQHIRVQSHQLATPEFSDPKELVAWMGAIQAQDYAMSKWAVGVRLKAAPVGAIEAALSRGDVLRTHVMRPTWHLVAAEDIRWMLQLSKDHLKSAYKSGDRSLGITEPLYAKGNRIVAKALEGNRHLTRQELAGEFTKAGVAVNNYRMAHFMMRAEAEGIACSGADRKGKRTYALLDERAPAAKALHREEALAALAAKYFRSHAPASLQDFAWWSGMAVKDAKQAVDLIRTELLTERFKDDVLLVHQSCRATAAGAATLHLLPAFDEYLIGYKDRTGVLAAEHQPKAFSKNVIFQPIIVQNGRVVGIWKKTAEKSRIAIRLSLFETANVSERRIKIASDSCKAFFEHGLPA